MKTILIILFTIAWLKATAAEQWFCVDDQAMRQGNTLSICGVGTSSTEGAARESALANAIREFHAMCNLSSDCHGHKISVEPKRSTCGHIMAGSTFNSFTCYRLFNFTIQ